MTPPTWRIPLSIPHLTGAELGFVQEAFESNWVAPLGPHVDAFEREFAAAVGVEHAVALSSGTAAIHLALLRAGVGSGDDVFVSTLTFAASVNPIRYLGAQPVFIDSETLSWNMDPGCLETALRKAAAAGRLPKAVIVVHLYGQSADLEPILELAGRYGVPVLEDAAEALGARYRDQMPGSFGWAGIFSFNGNKIITTSGGGMLVTSDASLATHARKLAAQAREPAPHYQHTEVGYNYRLSNVLAGIGRAQLQCLDQRVAARRRNFAFYHQHLRDVPGVGFMPEAAWGYHTRWLSAVTFEPQAFGADREAVRGALAAAGIEARPVWKPMHLQPVFAGCETVGGRVAEAIFEGGLCLPSGSQLTESELTDTIDVIRGVAAGATLYPQS